MNGADTEKSVLDDKVLLGALLFPLRDRYDVVQITFELIEIFGDIRGLFSASPERLLSLDGVPSDVIEFLLSLKQAFNKVLEDKLEETFQRTYPDQD